MLICFGLSWPLSLAKNIKARSARNMSLAFILLIVTGYVAGITAKILHHKYNYVLVVYLLNLFIVSLNIIVYFVNRKFDKGAISHPSRLHQRAYYISLWVCYKWEQLRSALHLIPANK